MPEKPRDVRGYLKELRGARKEKPAQVKEALEIYIGLWESALKRGVVADEDAITEALRKIDAAGGLVKAAGE